MESFRIPAIRVDRLGQNITEMLAVGPFDGQSASELESRNYLQTLGLSELSQDYSELEKVFSAADQPLVRTSSTGIVATLTKTYPGLDFRYLYGRQYGVPVSGTAAAYALFEVYAKQQRTEYLLLGSADEGIKVWVNGKIAYSLTNRRGLEHFDDTCPVELHEGRNVVLIKVWSGGGNWGLTARWEPSLEAAMQTLLDSETTSEAYLLRKNFYQPGEEFILAIRGAPKGASMDMTISDPIGRIVLKRIVDQGGSMSLPNDMNPGAHRVSITEGSVVKFENFYVGSPDDVYKALASRSSKWRDDSNYGPTVRELLLRCSIQLRASNRPKAASHTWERRLAYTFSELSQVDDLLERGEGLSHLSGLHIRGFRSEIDGQDQMYRIYVPSSGSGKGEKIALAVMLPTSISADRPFVESVFVAAHNEAERMAVLGEKYKVAVLWSGYRNKPQGIPCEFTHLDEVLDNVNVLYDIDPNRIYLFGACSVGAAACQIVDNRPGRFAAIGLLDPMFGVFVDAAKTLSFYKFPEFKLYLRQIQPLLNLRSITMPPVFIVNDGSEPGHGDIAISKAFEDKAKACGMNVTVELQPRTTAMHLGAWESIISWLVEHKAQVKPPSVGYSNDEETVAGALSTKFMVVTGSKGSPDEQIAEARISDAFDSAWKKTHFGPCRIKQDVSITAEEKATYNLVLIGTDKTNALWAEIAKDLPVRVDSESIKLEQKEWKGGRLAFQLVLKSPFNPRRKVILISGNQLNEHSFSSLDLSVQGWYSYAVWDSSQKEGSLIAAGWR